MKKFLLGCACVVLVAASAALMLGCGGGGSQATTGGSGRLTLGVTDAPVDGATAVVVRFTAVELKPAGGDAFTVTLDPAQTIQLAVVPARPGPPFVLRRTMPSNPALVGTTFSFQALTDSAVAPQGAAYTNPTSFVVLP